MKTNKHLLTALFLLCVMCDVVWAQSDSLSSYILHKTAQFKEIFDKNGEPRYHWYIPMPDHGCIVTELDWLKRQNEDFLSVLDGLYLEDKHEVHLKLLQERCTDEDNRACLSRGLYADSRLMNEVHLKDLTRENCWQWILLYHIRHFLKNEVPYSYHKQFILNDERWRSIVKNLESVVVPDSILQREEYEVGQIAESRYGFIKEYHIPQVPNILIDRDQNIVHASFFSWNSWSGLSDNHIYLKIIDGNRLTVISDYSSTIIEYSIGLIF